jgi:hypothetical protein
MTNENNTPAKSNQWILKNLDFLSGMFNDKARVDANVAEALTLAKDALKAEIDKNAELQKRLTIFENKDVYKKAKNKNFTFLIPATGSMQGVSLDQAKKNVLTFKERTSSNPIAVFWDNSNTVHMPVSQDSFKENNQFIQKLYGGSAFAKTLNTLPASQKSEHYIYIGNGNLVDSKETLEAGKKLLETSPKATLDFVSAHAMSPYMQEFAEQLAQLFPKRVSFHNVNNDASVDTAFTEILKLRTAPAPKKQVDAKPKL